jgi:hypothetical protein
MELPPDSHLRAAMERCSVERLKILINTATSILATRAHRDVELTANPDTALKSDRSSATNAALQSDRSSATKRPRESADSGSD